jgi:hypothetical protein
MASYMVKWIQVVHGMDQLRTVLLQEASPLSGSWQSLSGSVVRVSVSVCLMSTTQSLLFCMISEAVSLFLCQSFSRAVSLSHCQESQWCSHPPCLYGHWVSPSLVCKVTASVILSLSGVKTSLCQSAQSLMVTETHFMYLSPWISYFVSKDREDIHCLSKPNESVFKLNGSVSQFVGWLSVVCSVSQPVSQTIVTHIFPWVYNNQPIKCIN